MLSFFEYLKYQLWSKIVKVLRIVKIECTTVQIPTTKLLDLLRAKTPKVIHVWKKLKNTNVGLTNTSNYFFPQIL